MLRLRVSVVLSLALMATITTRSYASESGDGAQFKVVIGDPNQAFAALDEVGNKRMIAGLWVDQDNKQVAVAYRTDDLGVTEALTVGVLKGEDIGLSGWKPLHAIARDGNLGLIDVPMEFAQDEAFLGIAVAFITAVTNDDGTVKGDDVVGNKRLGLGYNPNAEYALVAVDLTNGNSGVIEHYQLEGITATSLGYAYVDDGLTVAAKYVDEAGAEPVGKITMARIGRDQLLAFANGASATWLQVNDEITVDANEDITALATLPDRLVVTLANPDGYRLQAVVIDDENRLVGINQLQLTLTAASDQPDEALTADAAPMDADEALTSAPDADLGITADAADQDAAPMDASPMTDDVDTVSGPITVLGFKGLTFGGNLGFKLGKGAFGTISADRLPGWTAFASAPLPSVSALG